jgi:septal ring factor EnvC (AmiA/AmiB activator)
MKELEKAKTDLKKQLTALQKEYGEMLYKASKSSGKITKLSFLFSSGSLTELFMRYKYLQQYSENRKSQLLQINRISEMLSQRQKALVEKKKKQQGLVGEIDLESKNLAGLVVQQNALVEELSKKEGEIKKEIETTRAAVKNLNNLISSVISKEVAKKEVARRETSRKENSKKEAAKKAPSRSGKEEPEGKKEEEAVEIKTTPERSNALSGSFRANRAKLPWPISEGFISDKFGVKSHPLLKGVMIDNNGIDIETTDNASVYSVFEGVVLDISAIPGLNNVVAIQHGDYYTVYANLNRVNVSINQKVGIKDIIGTAAKKDGSSEINFQIWHNFEKLNPEPWLNSK